MNEEKNLVEKKTVSCEEVQAQVKEFKAAINKFYQGAEDDPLIMFMRMKRVIDELTDSLKELKKDAVFAASVRLHDESPARESGRFEYKGYVFELSMEETFDFVKKPKRYTMDAGVQYRQLALQHDLLKKSAEAKTKLMKALKDNFAAEHPDWAPDSVTKSIKYIGLAEVN